MRGPVGRSIQQDPYRFLICADRFQTGYDEPLRHTNCVEKLRRGQDPAS
jgi:type I restriction enzyme R subunit